MTERTLSRPLLLAAVVGALFAGLLAEPEARADHMILESYAGARPQDADELLRPVYSALEKAGYRAKGAVAEQIEGRISRSSRPLSDEELSEARRFIDSGYQQFVSGSFQLAIKDLERGLALLQRSPATLARRQDQREVHMRALIGLSLSHKRLGDAVEAKRAMAELLRTFPDKEISYRDYGPEPRDFYKKVKEDLEQQGLGSLTVEVDDSSAVIFVNERYAGVGKVELKDLIPGRYRVYVQQGERPGRVHEVDVEADSPATLSLTWPLEASLHTHGGRAVLQFAGEAERGELEGRYAVRLARALDAGGVAVLSLRDRNGRRAVVGYYYSADSTRPERSAAVSVEPSAPSAERLGALGRFLAGDKTAAKLVERIPAAGPAPQPVPKEAPVSVAKHHRRKSRLWTWIALGGGLAGLGAGGTLIAIHRPKLTSDGRRNPYARNTRPAGLIVGAAGLLATGLSVYLFFREGGTEPRAAVSLAPTRGGGALTLTGRF